MKSKIIVRQRRFIDAYQLVERINSSDILFKDIVLFPCDYEMLSHLMIRDTDLIISDKEMSVPIDASICIYEYPGCGASISSSLFYQIGFWVGNQFD